MGIVQYFTVVVKNRDTDAIGIVHYSVVVKSQKTRVAPRHPRQLINGAEHYREVPSRCRIVHGWGRRPAPEMRRDAAEIPRRGAAEPRHNFEVPVFGGLADAVVRPFHLRSLRCRCCRCC